MQHAVNLPFYHCQALFFGLQRPRPTLGCKLALLLICAVRNKSEVNILPSLARLIRRHCPRQHSQIYSPPVPKQVPSWEFRKLVCRGVDTEIRIRRTPDLPIHKQTFYNQLG